MYLLDYLSNMKVCLSKTKILFASLSASIKYNMLETRFLTPPAKWLYFKMRKSSSKLSGYLCTLFEKCFLTLQNCILNSDCITRNKIN